MGTARLRRADVPRSDATIPELARELNALYRQWDHLTSFESCDVDARISGIEREIAARPAHGLTDAAVQLMIAAAYLESLEAEPENRTSRTLRQVRTLTRSALAAIAAAEGLDLSALGAANYLVRDRSAGGKPSA